MYSKLNKEIIYQGDIFQDVEFINWWDIDGKIDTIKIPFFVVLTQACDLDRDFNCRNNNPDKDDKQIPSVLVCPAYLAKLVRIGEHLKETGLNMEFHNSARWSLIKKNKNSRYHFFKLDRGHKIPELVVDFKQYYTIPTDILYKLYQEHYVCSLNDMFKEDLSHRFSFYLSRIGLPVIKNPHK